MTFHSPVGETRLVAYLHGRQGTCPTIQGETRDITSHQRDWRRRPARLRADPRSALGPALNDQGYYVGRVEWYLYYVTDGVYQSAFLTTPTAS